MKVSARNAKLTEAIGHVGVFLGGRSRERAISIRSGNAVYQALKGAGVIPI